MVVGQQASDQEGAHYRQGHRRRVRFGVLQSLLLTQGTALLLGFFWPASIHFTCFLAFDKLSYLHQIMNRSFQCNITFRSFLLTLVCFRAYQHAQTADTSAGWRYKPDWINNGGDVVTYTYSCSVEWWMDGRSVEGAAAEAHWCVLAW